MSTLKLRLLWGGGIAVTLGLAVWFAFVLKSDQGPDLSGKMAFDQKPGAQVPPAATFTDEQGKSVKIGDLIHDRPVVLFFAFYQCKGSCLLEFDSAVRAFRAMKTDVLGESYDAITVGLHPKETPELALAKKNNYLDQYNRPGAEKAWHFLTGKESETRKVADAVGFKYFYDEKKDMIVHPTGIVILTPGGKVARYFLGTEYSAPLIRDSLVAAATNEIFPASEKTFFLGCFQVDPATGKTLVHVQRATQLLGGVTLIALISSILVMNRKYKRGRYDAIAAQIASMPTHDSLGEEDAEGRS